MKEFDETLERTVEHPMLNRKVSYQYLLQLEAYKLKNTYSLARRTIRSNGGDSVYVVVVYDPEADRTQGALKFDRRYFFHVQNSGLEGEISEGNLATLKERSMIC